MVPSPCPRCASPLAEGTLSGQCPRCLANLAFGEPVPNENPGFLHRSGDLEFIRELGRGGMGVVYEARQISLNRRVAVKMLPGGSFARPEFIHRFQAEAEAVARLRHPNIVSIHEVGELEGQPFFAMELVSGPSLADLVRSQPVPPKRAARYVRTVAQAIAHAHSAGVLHRDLKPSNVLLDEEDQPRITDFGLAKLVDSAADLTRTGEVLGSPNYLPPEQVAGRPVGTTGDIYSIGAILYQLLTARPPFAADSVAATLQQVLQGDPIPPRFLNAGIPIDLETICLKCLRREPSRRYANAADLAADLTRFEAGEPIEARPVSRSERLALWCRRKPALAAVSTALAFAVIAGVSGVLTQWRRAEVSRAEMARNLFAADVAAASFALREGNLGRARELLLHHRPEGQVLRRSQPGNLPLETPTSPPARDPGEFTWRLLWNRCQGDDLTVLGSHPWIVTCVAASPDGRWIASGSQDQPDDRTHCLGLWSAQADPQNPSQGRTLASSNTLWSVAFTDDSRTLVSAGVEGVRFWDVTTGEPRRDFPELPGQEATLARGTLVASPNHPFFDAEHPLPLLRFDLETRAKRQLSIRGRHPALSPDGRRLAVLDEHRNIQLYDLATERLLFNVATNHLVFRLKFSPDGRFLIAAGQMTSAKVWDLDQPGAAPRIFESSHNVWDAALSLDGATLITATSHQQLEIWNFATRERLRSLSGHQNEVWTVAALPGGRNLVSGGKDRTVRLWDLTPPPRIQSAPHWRYARFAFSPDGTRLMTYAQTNGQGAATVWELPAANRAAQAAPRQLGTVGGYPRGFAPDGVHLLFVRTDRAALDWQNSGSPETSRTVGLEGSPTNLILSELALAGDSGSLACPDREGTFTRWTTTSGARLGSWSEPAVANRIRAAFADGKKPQRLFRGFAASRTGRWLALGTFETCTAVLVDFQSGSARHLRGHHDDVAALAFSADDQRLATGSVDGTIRLWETSSGQLLSELPGHLESVEAIAFSPDGRTLASVNPGIEVTLWHLPTRRELARLPHPEAGYHILFSPDGRRLALATTEGNLETNTDQVEIWNVP